MRDPNRMYGVLATIKEVWEQVPDWRFMQLICNFQRIIGSDGFYLEDDRLIEKLDELIK